MNYSYKQKKTGKVLAWLLTIILLIAAAGAVFVVLNKKDSDNTGSVDNGGGNNVDSEVTTIQEGLVMSAMPDFRLNEPIGLRYTTIISPELYNEVSKDENKSFGTLFGPLRFFTQVDTGESYEKIDWIKEFEKNELDPSFVESKPVAITSADGSLSHYIHKASIANIPYQGVNMQLLGIGFVKTVDGENVSYKYASLPEGLSYQDYACSYAYAAAEMLNERAALDLYMPQSNIDILKGVINQSVDLVAGLVEPTDNGSTYSVTLSETAKDLKLDEEFTINVEIAEEIPTSIWWQSTDMTVAIVKDGVVKAVGEGSATINVFVAGEKYTCSITVDNRIELPDAVE